MLILCEIAYFIWNWHINLYLENNTKHEYMKEINGKEEEKEWYCEWEIYKIGNKYNFVEI